jgi:SAM-dependent methyltransferase
MPFDRADFYDAELSRHTRHLRAAAQVGPRDRVLDIGCGAGQTSRDAARLAAQGSVLGVDISADLLAVARRRAADEGLSNVAFEQGDAQAHPFPPAAFDLCISRFGVMFFADPKTAFANIARGLRPGARLAWMVWQGEQRNEWATALQRALPPGTIPTGAAALAFSLGDPAAATGLLTAADFTAIEFAEVHEPVFYGPDTAAAYDALIGLYFARDTPDAVREERLRTLLTAHLTPGGVLFDSRAWIISAQRKS